MHRKSTTVRELSRVAGIDLDEALVMLWGVGFDEIDDINDVIPQRRTAEARRALGIGADRAMRRVDFWCKSLSMSREQITQLLQSKFEITLSPTARNLPKGALAKLRKHSPQARSHVGSTVHTTPKERPAPPEPPLNWTPIGQEQACQFLNVEEVLQIHDALVSSFAKSKDPISPPGPRDFGLLESAVSRPLTSLQGMSKYPTAVMSAAALLHSLVHNHAFHNGNKRTALVSMIVALDRNNKTLTCSQAELFKYVLQVSQHRLVPSAWTFQADREVLEISLWLNSRSRPVTKGERPITWRELKKRLAQFDCTFEESRPGNRMKIERLVTRTSFMGTRSKRLSFVAHYTNDGREIPRQHLHALRKRLELDNDSGTDSTDFYESKQRTVDDVISEYRVILKRLATL